MKMRTIVLLAATLCCAPMPGQPAARPRINFTEVLQGLDGKPLAGADKDKPLTLGDVAVTALESPTEDDKAKTGEEKFKLDQLARKVYQNKSVTLTVEEIATIKERIGKIYGPLVVGATYPLLDPAQK